MSDDIPGHRYWPGISVMAAFVLFCYFFVSVNYSLEGVDIGLKSNPFANFQQSATQAQQSIQKKPKASKTKPKKIPSRPKTSTKTSLDKIAKPKLVKGKNGKISLVLPNKIPPCGAVRDCQNARDYALEKLREKKFVGNQYKCLVSLWHGESGWNPWAHNTKSSAYGIPQAMERLYNHPYDDGDYKRQVDWGIRYIVNRYDSPCEALYSWLIRSPHWY